MVSGSISFPSRGAFHLSLTVLVHYRSPGYLALESGLPSFPPGSSCLMVLRIPSVVLSPFDYGTVTLFGRPFQARSSKRKFCNYVQSSAVLLWVLQPPVHNGGSLLRVQSLGSSRFVRHYYGNCLFSSGYLDVSVPPLASLIRGSLSITREGLPHSDIHGSACKQLPVTFRSVATSFFGPGCLGILHTLFLACYHPFPSLIFPLTTPPTSEQVRCGAAEHSVREAQGLQGICAHYFRVFISLRN